MMDSELAARVRALEEQVVDLQAGVMNLREAATAAVALLVRLLHDRDVVRESDARAFLLKAVRPDGRITRIMAGMKPTCSARSSCCSTCSAERISSATWARDRCPPASLQRACRKL